MDRRNLFWVDFIDGSMEPKFVFLLHARRAIQMDLFDGSNFFLSFDNFVSVHGVDSWRNRRLIFTLNYNFVEQLRKLD